MQFLYYFLLLENNSLDHDQNHMGNAQNSADQGGGDQQGGNSGGGLINSNSHTHSHSTKCTSDDESSSITSGSGQLGATSHNNSIHHSNSPLRVKPVRPGNKLTAFDSITPTTHHTPVEFYTVAEMDQLRQAIDEQGQECGRLNNEITLLKTQFQTDCSLISQSLQDEKYRVEVSGVLVPSVLVHISIYHYLTPSRLSSFPVFSALRSN